jgi:DNA-directed RNA polymerase omega subunit
MTKTFSRCSEVDTDKCVELAGGRYNLVLMASVRTREIASRNRSSMLHEHLHPNVTALLEIQEGKIGQEYLKKVR